MLVRFFAGAAAAAGVAETLIELPEQATGVEVVELLGHDNEALSRVLRVSTLLVDGVRLKDLSEIVGQASQIDVLPPFAGG